MKAEKILQGQHISFLLIPVPRQLSADCGMALRFSSAIRQAVEDVLDQAGLEISELWLMENGKYRRLT